MEEELKILVMDSAESVADELTEGLKRMGYGGVSSAPPDIPVGELNTVKPDLAVLGSSLSPEHFHAAMHKLKVVDPLMPVLACSDDLGPAVDLAALGFEGLYQVKAELDRNQVMSTVAKAVEDRVDMASRPEYPVLLGQSRPMRNIRQKVRNIADKDITVLVTGETGTGKELIARALHYYSRRHKGPLVKINCGALPDELLESEVFGFHKGAFTGAHKDKPGRFEAADRGTLFIDEIGNLSLPLQAKFFQILEDKTFSRLGGVQDRVVDARVIAATNSDLWQKVREGTFRKDLFYRLNVVHIKAPPLRERAEDIPLLVDYFLNKYCFEFNKPYLEVPEDVEELFRLYPWPGNVRELENVLRRAIVMRGWEFVFKELDAVAVSRDQGESPPSNLAEWQESKIRRFFKDEDFSLRGITKTYVGEAERKVILKTLKQTDWNRKKAARLLGVSYKTLLNRIAEFDLKP